MIFDFDWGEHAPKRGTIHLPPMSTKKGIQTDVSSRLRRVTDFMNYCDAVQARLEKGAITYGDRSFSETPALLLDELQQESLDLAGWGFILWEKIEAMKEALRK